MVTRAIIYCKFLEAKCRTNYCRLWLSGVQCLVLSVWYFAFGMRQYRSLIECHSLMLMLSGAFVVSVVRQLIELRKVELITQSDITCGFAIY